MQQTSTAQICLHLKCSVHPGRNQVHLELDRGWWGFAHCLEGHIRGRTEGNVVHIPSGPPMCKIGGVDARSASTRAAFFSPKLLPSAPGPLSTAPSTSTSGFRYMFLWLASLPSMLASLPFLPSLLPDPPSHLRLPPGSLPFNFLNGFKNGFRKSMLVVGRCGPWRGGGRMRS